jgi:type II secretory pathway component GspD/PulD (secretin)
MKQLTYVCMIWLVLGIPVASSEDASPSQSGTDSTPGNADSQTPGVPIDKVIDIVARKTGKKYVLDPRVHAQVQIVGQDLERLTYPELLTILQLYGFTAIECGGYVLVVPETNVRVMPLPLVSGKEVYPDSQFVSVVVPVSNGPAGALVPILRPLLPPYAHLAAAICSNSLLLVDTYANVRRIESLIKSLDTGDPYKPAKCEPPSAKAAAQADSKPS